MECRRGIRISEGLIKRLGLVGFIRRRGGETGSAGIENEISVFIQPTLQSRKLVTKDGNAHRDGLILEILR